jgi:hypothetical protein
VKLTRLLDFLAAVRFNVRLNLSPVRKVVRKGSVEETRVEVRVLGAQLFDTHSVYEAAGHLLDGDSRPSQAWPPLPVPGLYDEQGPNRNGHG